MGKKLSWTIRECNLKIQTKKRKKEKEKKENKKFM